jgi:hypothetical protein
MHLCLRVLFPSKTIFSQKVLPNLVEREKQEYVLPKLVECYSTITSFDLRRSKGTHDIFALVINFLKFDWQLKHITISLLKVNNITRQYMVNLNVMTMTLKFVVSFES